MESLLEERATDPGDKSRRIRERLARIANGGVMLTLEVIGGKRRRTRVPRKSLSQEVAREEALARESTIEDY